MKAKYRRWIPAILVRALFLLSIAPGNSSSWLATVWGIAARGLLLLVAIWVVVQTFRHRNDTPGYVGYRGEPIWIFRWIHRGED